VLTRHPEQSQCFRIESGPRVSCETKKSCI